MTLFWIQSLLRWTLSILLLIGVYSETGKWTTIAFGLILLGTELTTYALRKAQQAYAGAMKRTEELINLLRGLTSPPTITAASIRPQHLSAEVDEHIVNVARRALQNKTNLW